MHQLIYTSHATFAFADDDLLKLLHRSRQWNEHAGVTGLLLYGGGQFVQVLEGSAEAIDHLYNRMQRDLRHHTLGCTDNYLCVREQLG